MSRIIFTVAIFHALLTIAEPAEAIGGRVVVQKQVVVNRGFRSANVVVQRNVVGHYRAQAIVVQPFYAQQFVAPAYSQAVIAQPVVQSYCAPQAVIAPVQAYSSGCQSFFAPQAFRAY